MEDFFKKEQEAQAEANGRVRPEQVLNAGDFAVIEQYFGNIYSEILDPVAYMLDGRDEATLEEEERSEIEDTRASYAQPHMKYYRFTRGFSALCPHGELGDIHLSVVTRKITREEFLQAKARNWR